MLQLVGAFHAQCGGKVALDQCQEARQVHSICSGEFLPFNRTCVRNVKTRRSLILSDLLRIDSNNRTRKMAELPIVRKTSPMCSTPYLDVLVSPSFASNLSLQQDQG